jgi:hypothetical protein
MSNRFAPPTTEELAARGLNPDGTAIVKEEAKVAAVKTETKKAPAKKEG